MMKIEEEIDPRDFEPEENTRRRLNGEPDALHAREFGPVENRRRTRDWLHMSGGIGNPDAPRIKHFCAHCKKEYSHTPDLEFTDFGDTVDNLCGDCKKLLRGMRTNHPEMK